MRKDKLFCAFLRTHVNLKTKSGDNFRNGIIGAVLTVFVGLCLWTFPIGQGLEHLSYDLPTVFSSPFISDEVVIVQMDKASNLKFNPYLGPVSYRPWHARLLDRLKADGCKMVVLDVFLKGPGSEEADKDLIRALEGYERIVLPADRIPVAHPKIRAYTTVPPWSNFVAVATNWGIAAVEPDTDGIVRKHYPGENLDPSLPWAAALLAKAPLTNTPAVRLTERWLRYYGPYGSIRSLSYHMAFDQPNGYFRGKIIFIGGKPLTPQKLDEGDEFPTPYTRWDGQYTPGVEVMATMFLNLLHGDWLTRLSPSTEPLVIVLAGLLFGFGLSLARPLPGCGWACLSFLAVSAVALALFWNQHIWFDWVLIAGVQIPVAWACSAVLYTKELFREKQVLERRVATAQLLERVSPPVPSPAHLRPNDQPDRKEGLTQSDIFVPDYTRLRIIGGGSYGEVWLARNVTGAYRAIKVVHRKTFADDRPFDREFAGLKNFEPISRSHRGLVEILHVGRDEQAGYFYYVMEAADDVEGGKVIDPDKYVPKTLGSVLAKKERLPLDECFRLGLSLTDALGELHRHELIHRDVKPSNIIFVNNIPKLADIGLVAQMGRSATFVGTEGYVPPEGPGEVEADIFSLGKVIYQAATGCDPQDYPTLPPSLAERSDARELMKLIEIVNKACDNNVKRRYHSAAELHAELLKLQAELDQGPGE